MKHVSGTGSQGFEIYDGRYYIDVQLTSSTVTATSGSVSTTKALLPSLQVVTPYDVSQQIYPDKGVIKMWNFSTSTTQDTNALYPGSGTGVTQGWVAIEFASTSTNSILEDTAFLAIEKYKKDFPVGGAVLFMVHGMSGDQESLDSRGAGIYFLTEDLLKYIDDTKEKIAAAELKAKQEAEAKAAAELKAKQDAEAKAAADKAAAELKAKQDAEAKAAADKAELKAKQDAEAKAAATKKTTITCVKGKLTKKVTAVKPACPTGYKKK
jgi:hypothetical protein